MLMLIIPMRGNMYIYYMCVCSCASVGVYIFVCKMYNGIQNKYTGCLKK